MKKHKNLIVGLLVGLLLFFITAILVPENKPNNKPYEFRKPFDQIESIEIAVKEYGYGSYDAPMEVVLTIDSANHSKLIESLLAIPGGRSVTPGSGFGSHIIVITYKDGMKEYLGSYNNGYMTADGKMHYDSYAFESNAFFKLISFYVGEEVTEPMGPSPTAPKDKQ